MALPYVECSTRPGLRDSEAGVTVHDITGRPERLRVEWDFLHKEGDQYYLPIGIVARHPSEPKVVIEFPHEANSGANRILVAPEQLLPTERPVRHTRKWVNHASLPRRVVPESAV